MRMREKGKGRKNRSESVLQAFLTEAVGSTTETPFKITTGVKYNSMVMIMIMITVFISEPEVRKRYLKSDLGDYNHVNWAGISADS